MKDVCNIIFQGTQKLTCLECLKYISCYFERKFLIIFLDVFYDEKKLANIEGISMGKRETRTEPYYSIIYQYIFIIIQT